MKIKLSRNEKILIIGVSAVLILIFASIYFFVLYPKIEQIPLKKIELASQEQLLSTLQSKTIDANANTFQNAISLQKMVPVKELSQQLILDMEKAEVVSGSFVTNMNFENSEVSFAAEETEQSELNEDEELEEERAAEEENTLPLPTGVKKISVTLSVESPSYFEFEKFISNLENSERITVVEAIDFTAGEEIIEQEQSDRPLSYQVKIAAFYMPTLADLMEQLPKLETPEPADKKNPLPKFGDL